MELLRAIKDGWMDGSDEVGFRWFYNRHTHTGKTNF